MRLCVHYFVILVTLVPLCKTRLRQSAIGGTCMYNTDCKPEYSYCYNREECRCKKNYTLNSKSELCVPECSSDKGCPYGEIKCTSSVCKCDKHFIKLNENCVKRDKVHLGEKCIGVDDCIETNTSEVQCLNDVCTCGNGYRHIGNDVCLPGYLGSECNKTNECNSLNGTVHCDQGICQCKENFLKSNLLKTCLKLATLNQLCQEHQQCTVYNTECIDSKCQCIKGYRIEQRKCVRNADLGENCTTNKECNPLFGASYCNKGECDCKAPEYIKSTRRHNSCLKVSKYGTFCEEKYQCPENSKCIKGKCDCEFGFQWNNYICEPNSAQLLRRNVWTMVIIVLVFLIY